MQKLQKLLKKILGNKDPEKGDLTSHMELKSKKPLRLMKQLQKLLKKTFGNKNPEKNDKINDFIVKNLPPTTSEIAIEYTEMNGRISDFQRKEISQSKHRPYGVNLGNVTEPTTKRKEENIYEKISNDQSREEGNPLYGSIGSGYESLSDEENIYEKIYMRKYQMIKVKRKAILYMDQ